MGRGKCILEPEKLLIFKFFLYLEKIADGKADNISEGETQRSIMLRLTEVTGRSLSSIQRVVRTGKSVPIHSIESEDDAIAHSEEKNQKLKEVFTLRHNKNRLATKSELSVAELGLIRTCIYNFHKTEKRLITLAALQMKIKTDFNINLTRTTMFRVLHKIGFKFVKSQNNRVYLIEKPEIVKKRKEYLISIEEYRSQNRPIVYLDESYVHTYYTAEKSWYDKSINGFRKKIGKGQRFIIGNIKL